MEERHKALAQFGLEVNIPKMKSDLQRYKIDYDQWFFESGPRGLQDRGQGVPQHAAPGVAHVHGAGGVGGDELHHDLPALQGVGAAVPLPLALHGGERAYYDAHGDGLKDVSQEERHAALAKFGLERNIPKMQEWLPASLT